MKCTVLLSQQGGSSRENRRDFRWLAEHGEVSDLQSSEVWKGVGLDHPVDTELCAGVQSFELGGKAHK